MLSALFLKLLCLIQSAICGFRIYECGQLRNRSEFTLCPDFVEKVTDFGASV